MRQWMGAALAVAVLGWNPAQADQASAVKAVKAQPKAVDARADKSGNLYVLVKPESIQWSKYAQAMCSVVKPHQARIFRVRVVDVTKANYGKPEASWDRIGEAACSE